MGETFRAQIPNPEQGRIGDIDIVEEWGMERTAARVHRGYLSAEDVIARAHLLAAAPDLLAALERAVETLAQFGWGVETEVAIRTGRAAIAKAYGEASRAS